jgi:hypothetical protein
MSGRESDPRRNVSRLGRSRRISHKEADNGKCQNSSRYGRIDDQPAQPTNDSARPTGEAVYDGRRVVVRGQQREAADVERFVAALLAMALANLDNTTDEKE